MKLTDKTVKFIKRILGIAVPSLIILITVIMVSVSFAWFSSDVKPSVQTIKMTTAKAFTLSFTAEENSSLRNINYKGQTAIDKNGRLVTDYNGSEYPRPDKVELNQYLLDMPYYFITTIALDTENTQVTMSMLLDAAKISKNGSVLNSYDSGDGSFKPEDMPYAFTWYFKAHSDKSQNYTGTVNGDEDNRAMDNRLPSEGEEWYTPYGKLTFDASGLIAKVNDEPVNNAPVSGEESGEERYSLLGGGLKEMLLTADNTQFDFYIVFAPQKLFWAQFCVADRALIAEDIYTGDELIKIYGASSNRQMYYSNMAYFGSKFEFGATLTVSSIDGNPVD